MSHAGPSYRKSENADSKFAHDTLKLSITANHQL